MSDHDHPKQSKSDAELGADQKRLSKKRPVGWIVRMLVGLVVVALLLLVLAVAWVSTSKGTEQLLSLMSKTTGVSVEYEEGNLISGLHLLKVEKTLKDGKTLTITDANVRLGWRVILGERQIHLASAKVASVVLENPNPPGPEFSYPQIKLPFTLHVDQLNLGKFVYSRKGEVKTQITNVSAQNFHFAGSTLELENGQLSPLAFLQVNELEGSLSLEGGYPISATGELVVTNTTPEVLEPIQVSASGTLETLKLEGGSKLLGSAVQLTGSVSPMQRERPLEAVLTAPKLLFAQNSAYPVTLDSTTVKLSGPLINMNAELDSTLLLKDLSPGKLTGSGTMTFKGLSLEDLNLESEWLRLSGPAKVQFTGPTKVGVAARFGNFELSEFVPEAVSSRAKEFSQGRINFGYAKQAKLQSVYVNAVADTGTRLVSSVNLNPAKPTAVKAQLEHVGSADLPQGSYNAALKLAGSNTFVDGFNYTGVAGEAQGSGVLRRAAESNFKLSAKRLRLGAFTPAAAVQDVVASSQTELSFTQANNKLVGKASPLSLSVQKGSNPPLELQGSLGFALKNSNAALSYTGKAGVQDQVSGTLKLDLQKQDALVKLGTFDFASAQGSASMSGQINTAAPLSWSLDANFKNFNPEALVSGLSGNLNGNLKTQGVFGSSVKKATVGPLAVQGSLKGKPLSASGLLALDLSSQKLAATPAELNSQIQAKDFNVTWGSNTLEAKSEQGALRLNASINSLSELSSMFAGELNAAASVTPAGNSADVQAKLKANQFKLGSLTVAEADLSANVQSLGKQPSQVSLSATELSAGAFSASKLELAAKGVLENHSADLFFERGSNRVETHLTGSYQSALGKWSGRFFDSALGYNELELSQDEPAAFVYSNQIKRFEFAANCWSDSAAGSSVCFVGNTVLSAEQAKLNLKAQNLSAQLLSPFLPSAMVWSGGLSGQVKLNKTKAQPPNLDAVLYTDNGRIGIRPLDPQDPPTTVGYQRLSLIVRTTTDGVQLRFDAKTPESGSGYVDVVIDPNSEQKTINGALVLDDIDLQIVRPFVPGVRALSGTASLAGGMSGPLKGPQFYGEFNLKNGAVNLIDAPLNVTALNMKSSIRGDSLSFDSSFLSGTGKGALSGSASWKDDAVLNAKLTGQRLEIRQPPVLYAQINPSIDLTANLTQKRAQVGGQVNVMRGTIRPAGGNSDVIEVSEDVVVYDLRQSSAEGVQARAPWQIEIDLGVDLVEEVYFRGFGAQIPLGGVLNVTKSAQGDLRGQGRIYALTRSRVEVFGQDLELTNAEVTFNGVLTQPTLNVSAMKRISGHQVGVRVGGRGLNPEIELFNDAGLSEQQAMNALITGRIFDGAQVSEAGFRQDVNNVLAAAGLSAGLQQTRQFTNSIGRSLGLTGLAIDATGSDSDTNVNITGYITPKLLLRYGVGVFTPVDKLTLRYQVSQRVYVEATSALERAIDVFYTWRF